MSDTENDRDLYEENLKKIFELQMRQTQEMWQLLNSIFDRGNGDLKGLGPKLFTSSRETSNG